ncbi:MAG TPA: LolA-related protein [Rhodocyclaceae bacterium]|nr:LolA-related protein [Rhodocyclaceae bacterium]
MLLVTGVALMQAIPGMAGAADWQISDLMALLAQTKSGKATFVEQKYIGLLDKPVESSGELSFTAPDQLEKRTLKPKPESMVLKGDDLTLERGKQSMHMSLQERPEVAALVDSIRATLTGDQAALERTYKLSLDGDEKKWVLTLTPLSPDVANMVAHIRISGTRGTVHVIEIEQSDGDHSIMTISPMTGT